MCLVHRIMMIQDTFIVVMGLVLQLGEGNSRPNCQNQIYPIWLCVRPILFNYHTWKTKWYGSVSSSRWIFTRTESNILSLPNTAASPFQIKLAIDLFFISYFEITPLTPKIENTHPSLNLKYLFSTQRHRFLRFSSSFLSQPTPSLLLKASVVSNNKQEHN